MSPFQPIAYFILGFSLLSLYYHAVSLYSMILIDSLLLSFIQLITILGTFSYLMSDHIIFKIIIVKPVIKNILFFINIFLICTYIILFICVFILKSVWLYLFGNMIEFKIHILIFIHMLIVICIYIYSIIVYKLETHNTN
jgi:hypothetical protein